MRARIAAARRSGLQAAWAGPCLRGAHLELPAGDAACCLVVMPAACTLVLLLVSSWQQLHGLQQHQQQRRLDGQQVADASTLRA